VKQTLRKPDRRVARARTLRRAMTEAEQKLWWHLRNLPVEGTHFRRQATIGPYFADFACHQHRLVIEVDGSQHGDESHAASDQERTAFLKSHGYRVLRFWNNEVLDEIDAVTEAIYTALNETQALLPPTPNPSPPREGARGEGNPEQDCNAGEHQGALEGGPG
jgi:very-short-patch-repair endonuclease